MTTLCVLFREFRTEGTRIGVTSGRDSSVLRSPPVVYLGAVLGQRLFTGISSVSVKVLRLVGENQHRVPRGTGSNGRREKDPGEK